MHWYWSIAANKQKKNTGIVCTNKMHEYCFTSEYTHLHIHLNTHTHTPRLLASKNEKFYHCARMIHQQTICIWENAAHLPNQCRYSVHKLHFTLCTYLTSIRKEYFFLTRRKQLFPSSFSFVVVSCSLDSSPMGVFVCRRYFVCLSFSLLRSLWNATKRHCVFYTVDAIVTMLVLYSVCL